MSINNNTSVEKNREGLFVRKISFHWSKIRNRKYHEIKISLSHIENITNAVFYVFYRHSSKFAMLILDLKGLRKEKIFERKGRWFSFCVDL